jgi:hypothetical protein
MKQGFIRKAEWSHGAFVLGAANLGFGYSYTALDILDAVHCVSVSVGVK